MKTLEEEIQFYINFETDQAEPYYRLREILKTGNVKKAYHFSCKHHVCEYTPIDYYLENLDKIERSIEDSIKWKIERVEYFEKIKKQMEDKQLELLFNTIFEWCYDEEGFELSNTISLCLEYLSRYDIEIFIEKVKFVVNHPNIKWNDPRCVLQFFMLLNKNALKRLFCEDKIIQDIVLKYYIVSVEKERTNPDWYKLVCLMEIIPRPMEKLFIRFLEMDLIEEAKKMAKIINLNNSKTYYIILLLLLRNIEYNHINEIYLRELIDVSDEFKKYCLIELNTALSMTKDRSCIEKLIECPNINYRLLFDIEIMRCVGLDEMEKIYNLVYAKIEEYEVPDLDQRDTSIYLPYWYNRTKKLLQKEMKKINH